MALYFLPADTMQQAASSFPCHNFMGGTLKLQAQINPSLPTLFLWYFVKAIWTETDYIVENTSSQRHVVVCAGSTNICDHKTDQTDTCDSTKSHEEARTIMRKSQCKNNSLFSPWFYWQSIERPLAIALSSFLHIRNRRQAFSLIGVELSYYWAKALVFTIHGPLNFSFCLPSMGLLNSHSYNLPHPKLLFPLSGQFSTICHCLLKVI